MSTPPTGSHAPRAHRLDVQGLRAIAVILVVLYHAGGLLPGGFIGVDVFFVLSGYVITLVVHRRQRDDVGIDLKDFYARRVRRIMPALAFFLVGTLAMSALVLSPFGPQAGAAKTARATSFLVANLALYRERGGYFDPSSEFNPFLHMWSLAVEEQFYLGLPLLVWGIWRLTRRRGVDVARRVVMASLVVVAVGSFLASVLLTRRWVDAVEDPIRLAFYTSPTRAWEFLAGAFIALGAARLDRIGEGVRRICLVLGAALIVIPAFLYDGGTIFPGLAAIPPVLGTALLIAAPVRTPALDVLSRRPLVYLGDRSYSWYLWHWPFVVFARTVISDAQLVLLAAGILALAPAVISYDYIEQPFRSADRWHGRRVVVLGLTCLVVPVLAATALATATDRGFGSDAVTDTREQLALHADVVRGCDGAGFGAPACVWPATERADEAPDVVLLGDSNAGHFTEVLAAASARSGLDLVVASRSSCPFVDLVVVGDINGDSDAACRDVVSETIDAVIAAEPAAVVIASATDRYLDEATSLRRDGEVATTPDERAILWEASLATVIDRFTAADIPVLVVHPTPRFPGWSFDNCTAIEALRDLSGCGQSRPRAQADSERADAIAIETAAAATSPLASSLDLTDDLCTESTCATNTGTAWLYRDASHLSVPGALSLLDTFDEALRTMLTG